MFPLGWPAAERSPGLPRPCLAAEKTETPGAGPFLWGLPPAGPGLSSWGALDGQVGQGRAWCIQALD